ncbi:uncharacterized protein A4U43_C01F3600 [Asparagus officinalis]|uniref:Uncharacterized protein n=1 Tax=Asparagus officinalis TaxID=4686 RepID=A0A5P1FLH3_ASPOF|nr:uncharacterized protein A4U43_C01F3600 [Asparagus officinalis]
MECSRGIEEMSFWASSKVKDGWREAALPFSSAFRFLEERSMAMEGRGNPNPNPRTELKNDPFEIDKLEEYEVEEGEQNEKNEVETITSMGTSNEWFQFRADLGSIMYNHWLASGNMPEIWVHNS